MPEPDHICELYGVMPKQFNTTYPGLSIMSLAGCKTFLREYRKDAKQQDYMIVKLIVLPLEEK